MNAVTQHDKELIDAAFAELIPAFSEELVEKAKADFFADRDSTFEKEEIQAFIAGDMDIPADHYAVILEMLRNWHKYKNEASPELNESMSAYMNGLTNGKILMDVISASGDMENESSEDRVKMLVAIIAAISIKKYREHIEELPGVFLKKLEELRASDPQKKFTIYDAMGAFAEDARKELATLSGTESSEIPRIGAKKALSMLYPIDNVNSKVWTVGMLDAGETLRLKAEKTGSPQEINILYSIDFEELGKNVSISKELTSYDKRVYFATSALFSAGNEWTTHTYIHYAMGNRTRPAASDIEKIDRSLTKLTTARIHIDNQEESAAYRTKRFVYDGSLLPMERGRAYIGNAVSETAIHIFREPPLTTYARKRKQFTTISSKLLLSPLSKTDANLMLEDYLITRISHMKKPNSSNKIRFATICEKCNATTKKQKQRMPEKIVKLLDHFKSTGFIKGYAVTDDGYSISL